MRKLHVKYLIDESGEKAAAVLPMADFRELLDRAQDAIDVKLINKVQGEPCISWEQSKRDRRAKARPR
jgi:hypothetical protein